jgi:hypothetical protein
LKAVLLTVLLISLLPPVLKTAEAGQRTELGCTALVQVHAALALGVLTWGSGTVVGYVSYAPNSRTY